MNEEALKIKVQASAQTLGIPFNDAFHRLVMERFLVRISQCHQRSHFVLKGDFLLALTVNPSRDVRELDLLLQGLRGEKGVITRTLSEIAAINTGDEFTYTIAEIGNIPAEHASYSGFRATFNVSLGKLRDTLNVDIGVGDLIKAQSENLRLMVGKGKALFENTVSLLVYPSECLFAEKLQTAVSREEQGSRMKDYFDILSLSGLIQDACGILNLD